MSTKKIMKYSEAKKLEEVLKELHKIPTNVTREGYVAMNKGQYDLSNMTFYNKDEFEKAKRHWGDKQDIIKVLVTFQVN